MSDASKKPFFVTKKDAKNSNLWNEVANERIDKQHPGGHIGEGDQHAAPKYDNPSLGAPMSEEESKEALDELQTKLKVLEEQNKKLPPPPAPKQETSSSDDNDDWYD